MSSRKESITKRYKGVTGRTIIRGENEHRFATASINDLRDYKKEGFIPVYPPGYKKDGESNRLLYDSTSSYQQRTPYYERPTPEYSEELKNSLRAFHEPSTTNASGSRRYQKDSFTKKASKVATEALLDPGARKSVLWTGKQGLKLLHSPSQFLNENTGYGQKRPADSEPLQTNNYGDAIRRSLKGNLDSGSSGLIPKPADKDRRKSSVEEENALRKKGVNEKLLAGGRFGQYKNNSLASGTSKASLRRSAISAPKSSY